MSTTVTSCWWVRRGGPGVFVVAESLRCGHDVVARRHHHVLDVGLVPARESRR